MKNDTWYEPCMHVCLSVYARMQSLLDEKQRRNLAGCICLELGHGSVVRFHNETGMAVSTIRIGRNEAKSLPVSKDDIRTEETPYRTRRSGGGRKKAEDAFSNKIDQINKDRKTALAEEEKEKSIGQPDDPNCGKAEDDPDSSEEDIEDPPPNPSGNGHIPSESTDLSAFSEQTLSTEASNENNYSVLNMDALSIDILTQNIATVLDAVLGGKSALELSQCLRTEISISQVKDQSTNVNEEKITTKTKILLTELPADARIENIIQQILEDTPLAGGPETHLTYTAKSARVISDELRKEKIFISPPTVSRIIREQGYSVQKNKKYLSPQPRTEAVTQQLDYIMDVRSRYEKNPNVIMISMDTLHKIVTGNRYNGSCYCKKRHPIIVDAYDFAYAETRTLTPQGFYLPYQNVGKVYLSEGSCTPELTVRELRLFLSDLLQTHSNIERLIILCDGGGGNSSRSRVWKAGLQFISNEFSIAIEVHHFPPGFSKYDPIEWRMWGQICINMRGIPLLNADLVKRLIENTTTRKGLTVSCEYDSFHAQPGLRLGEGMKKDQFESFLNIERETEHNSLWNYTINPANNEMLIKIIKMYVDASKKAEARRAKTKAKKQEKPSATIDEDAEDEIDPNVVSAVN